MTSESLRISEQHRIAVTESWQKVVPIADVASSLFYQNLFDGNPEIEALFQGVDLEEQKIKLVHAISAVVQSINEIDAVVPMLEELGHRHIGYGVKEAHYDDVGNALLKTLETGLADHWNEDVKQAWVEVYTLVSAAMRVGYRIDHDNQERQVA